MGFLKKLKSRKFLVTILGLATALATGDVAQMQEATLALIGVIVASYNVGQGLSDKGKASADEH